VAKRKKVAGLGNSESFPGDRLLKVTTREGKNNIIMKMKALMGSRDGKWKSQGRR
jgi:hypothetical protein